MTTSSARATDTREGDELRVALASSGLVDPAELGQVWRRCTYHLPYRVTVVDAEVAAERQTFVVADTRHPKREGEGLTVFAYPDDPFLPDLADLAREPGAEVLAYRPTRRAVLSLPGRGYAKVAPPARIEKIARAHALLGEANLPVARILAHHPGHIVMSRVRGRPLTALLNESGGAATYDAICELLDRLPDSVLGLPARASWCERIDRHAAIASRLLPDPRIAVIARVVAAEVAGVPPGERVATHGDFYESNVLTDGPRITGLLDIDTVGPGYRIDDVACLLGHLSATRRYRDDGHYRRRVRDLFAAACADHDAARLAIRTAGVLLTLVPGALRHDNQPARVRRDLADFRLGVARGWLAVAEL